MSFRLKSRIPEPQATALADLHKDNLRLAKEIQQHRHQIELKLLNIKDNSKNINTLAYEAIIAAGYDETVEVDLDRNIFRSKKA